MASLTVNNNTYQYPDPGSEEGWGEDATGWAEDVTAVLESVAGAGDIILRSATLDNNQSTYTDISGMSFNSTIVRGIQISYWIKRASTTPAVEYSEKGILELSYNSLAADWYMNRSFVGDDAGIIFNVTSTGQIQYKSSNMSATGYSGIIKFETRSTIEP